MSIFGLLELLCVLVAIAGIAGAVVGVLRKTCIIAALLGIVGAIGFSGITIVDPGYVGVVKTFGLVHEKKLDSGPHWTWPIINQVTQMETRLKTFAVDSGASSKDLQPVHTVVSVQHSLNGSMAPNAYQTVGDLSKFDANVVNPAVLEAVKAVTAHHTAEELITQREDVKAKIVEAIQSNIDRTLDEKGVKGALTIANVSIQDFSFSDGFNHSIEAKVKSAQEALQAKNEKTKRITLAEAEKREKELDGEGEAYKINAVSIAQAAAIKREGEALANNPNLIKLRFIQAWKGKLPTYSGGNVVPFINVDKIGDNATNVTPETASK